MDNILFCMNIVVPTDNIQTMLAGDFLITSLKPFHAIVQAYGWLFFDTWPTRQKLILFSVKSNPARFSFRFVPQSGPPSQFDGKKLTSTLKHYILSKSSKLMPSLKVSLA